MIFSQCPPPVNYIQPAAYYAGYNITYPNRDLPVYSVTIKDTPISFSIPPSKMFIPCATNTPFSLNFTVTEQLDTSPYNVVYSGHGTLLKTTYTFSNSQNTDFISYLNSTISSIYPNVPFTIDHYTRLIYNYSLTDISVSSTIIDNFSVNSFYSSYGTVPYYPVRLIFSNGDYFGFLVPIPDLFLPADYPLDTDIPDPVPINPDDGILSWLYNLGGLALGSSNLINQLLSIDIGGANLFYILFGGGFLLYAGWCIVKWFIPI